MKLILASASPRRKELLKLITDKFDILVADINEHVHSIEDVIKTAKRKADYIFKTNQDCLILAADTVVVSESEILGKPIDVEHAKAMLQKLSGKTHSVFTAVVLKNSQIEISELIETRIQVSSLTDSEIEHYINEEYILDAAGSYKIQGCFSKFISKITGDYNNVVGLPVYWVYNELKNLNFSF